MLKRELIMQQVNSDLTFLDDKWDTALIGYAERGGKGRHILPCYGYQVVKALLRDRGYTPDEMYHRLQIFINSMKGDKPLLLTRYNRKSLWKVIKEKNYPRWELLDQAIIGLGATGWVQRGIVYSKPLCANILQASQSTAGKGDIFDAASSVTQLESSIIPVDLGEFSPWFVTPV